jgi:Family of unknown function (DUF6228)
MDVEAATVHIGDPEGASITFSGAGDPGIGYDFTDFTARVSAPGLSARSHVRSIEGAQGLREFFRSLAADWRGWEGARTWESIEHDLSIEARVDRRGHVRLAFTLRQSYRAEAWSTTIVVEVDAGEEMTNLASAIDELLKV